MRKFNILYIENFSDIIGGGQISLLSLLERLDKNRFNPIAVCPARGSLASALESLNIETKIIEMQSLKKMNIPRIVKSILEIRRFIKERNIDLIHANGSRACFYAGIAARMEKVPLIWHVRIAKPDGLLDRFLAGLSTKIIAISYAVNKRFIWMKNREEMVKTIYNGIDFKKFNPSFKGEHIRKEFGLNNQAPLVGMVGRLDCYKGYQYFLKAAQIVINAIPECRFLIVGEGEKKRNLENLIAKLNLTDKVIFSGYRVDIPDILASLDLFVLSSVSEGLGRSIIEAMAMEKAVVATNVGGIPEVVKDKETGIIVPARDELTLANSIIELVKNKDMALKMGLAGRKLAEEKFNLNSNVEKTQALYMDLL